MEPAVKLEFDNIKKRVTSLEDNHKDMKEAFPAGDFDGHCTYHEFMIEEARDRKKLIALIKEKTIGGLIWIFIVFIAGLLIHGLHDTVYNWLHDGTTQGMKKPPSPPE